METSMKIEKKTGKKTYLKPTIRSQKVLERAALACSGTFSNSRYNTKNSYYSCGFNAS